MLPKTREFVQPQYGGPRSAPPPSPPSSPLSSHVHSSQQLDSGARTLSPSVELAVESRHVMRLHSALLGRTPSTPCAPCSLAVLKPLRGPV